MSHRTTQGDDLLIENLNGAVLRQGADEITRSVKKALEEAAHEGRLRLSDDFSSPRPDRYARRLLHRDEERGYSVVVMTWGPGQRTQLHDHAGMWCVECVVRGQMFVTRYDLVEQRQGRFRFVEQPAVRAGVGEVGCLIPPYEHHVLGNALADRTSVTLHVYGGDMARCHLYLPADGDWWERQDKLLTFDP